MLRTEKLRKKFNQTCKENTYFAILSVIYFIYFITNFEDLTFIRQNWDVDGLAQHFTDKMFKICRKCEQQGYIPAVAIIDFLFEPSRSSQKKFIVWVQSNYHLCQNHKTL